MHDFHRTKRQRLGRSAALTAAVLLLGGIVAEACNVPVFRFALERWRPDPYRVVLFHRGPLSEAQQALIGTLEAQQDKPLANFIFRTANLDALEGTIDDRAAAQELFASQDNPSLPWLTVQYPVHLGVQKPVWAGPLAREPIASLLDSPIRKQIVKRLVEGQTAVWLLLESGQKEQDEAAAGLVQAELTKLEKELKLPELSDAPDDKVSSDIPLRIGFSLLRVSRQDAAEQALVKMLIHSESDLADRTDPLVFPVFGRGRALFALVGQGITADNVRESAVFLTGACSCEVKQLNPGFDLLLATDWEAYLGPASDSPFAAVAVRDPASPVEPQLVPIPPGSSAAPEESSTATNEEVHSMSRRPAIVSGIVVLGLLAVVALLATARRRA